jgi:branched-chain amino acid transport system substrate-binding protein
VVVGIGITEIVTKIMAPLEAQWGDDPALRRPTYLLSEGVRTQELLDLVKGRDDLRARLRGTNPGTNNPLSRSFFSRYQAAQNPEPLTFGMPGAYDAPYLLAYAAVAAGGDPLTGPAVAQYLRRTVGGPAAQAIDAGPGGLTAAFDLLRAGQSIDYNGASGPLEFDAKGEAPSDIQVWCVIRDGGGEPSFLDDTGIYYDAAKNAMVGRFNCQR